MGPSAVRVAGLEARLEALGHEVEDGGNVPVAIPEQKKEGDTHAKYLKEITATCTKSAELVVKTLEAGKVPLALGGDHSMAAGTVSGVAEFYRRQNQSVGLIWIDAHTDINTPDSSPSGNVHGMPLAALMGLWPSELGNIFDFSPKVKPQNCVLVGVRDIDAVEKENVRRAGIGVFTMRDIDERGMRTVMEEALRMAGRGTAGYHISLDMDWVDPEDAPGVGTPVRGGATYREAHLAMEIIADHGRMLSFEIVEVNPGHRRAQQNRRPGGRVSAVGVREEDSVEVPGCPFLAFCARSGDFGSFYVGPGRWHRPIDCQRNELPAREILPFAAPLTSATINFMATAKQSQRQPSSRSAALTRKSPASKNKSLSNLYARLKKTRPGSEESKRVSRQIVDAIG